VHSSNEGREKYLKSDILLFIDASASDDDLTFIDTYLPETLAERLRNCEHVGALFYSVPESYKGRLAGNKSCFVRTGQDDVEFWKDLFARTGSEHLCKIYADSPFLDISMIKEMIELHLKYIAEFTFSENLPAGLSCEIVSKELTDAIPEFKEKTLPLTQVIKSNINNFDIEIYYKDPDIRDKRISFLSCRLRDRRIMENIHNQHKSIPPYEAIKEIIEKTPEVVYVGPSYLEIELAGQCDLDCLFCYRKTLKQVHGELDSGLFKKILEQMKYFKLPYTVCFGGSGEPLMHRSFYDILDKANNERLVETIMIETNGIYADANYRTVIMNSGRKIKTIVNINGMNSETYVKIHGKDFFDTVHQNVIALKEIAGDRLYIQIMKIRETEPYLDAYYDYWEKQKIPIILQKQNTYLGRIEDRRYSDLSPLDRIPCWHLQRDLYITADGSVSFCKQDVDGEFSCGHIGASALADIWEKKKGSFIQEYKKDFPKRPDCKSCDEWYTFNF
jgi:spiro-SPASM protein